MIENGGGTTANVNLFIVKNGTAFLSTNTLKEVGAGQIDTIVLEALLYLQKGEYIEFNIYSDQAVTSTIVSASSPYPLGYANQLDIHLVERYYEQGQNAKVTWSSGLFNLTNGTDNPIQFNDYVESSIGASVFTPNLLSSANASIQINETGVYMIDTFANFYDLGSSITMSTTIYTSTNGTTWSFLSIVGLQRYEGTNTNQVQQGKYMLRVTSTPLYVQMRVNPSGNSPYPYNVSPDFPSMTITKIGDI